MSDKDTIYKQDAIDAVCPEHYALSTLPSAQQYMIATSNTMVSDTVKIPVMDGTTERLPSAQPKHLVKESGDLVNDCISRQDAIKYFAELWECIKTISDREEWEDICVTTVNEIKSAEPKRKKGHWVYYDEYAEAVTHTCSECGKRMTTAIGVKASFCWNCGADMRGEQNE